jgi:hypothetical protein
MFGSKIYSLDNSTTFDIRKYQNKIEKNKQREERHREQPEEQDARSILIGTGSE